MKKSFSSGFMYLRDSSTFFVPRTQATALKGVQEGLLPEEAFVFRAVNVRPIFEEPYDIMEIERLLARKDLDTDTILLLMRIFEKLIKDADKELALFAAESINAIELRYNQRVHGLRKSLESAPIVETARSLVTNLFTLGVINFSRPVLKSFYLKESQRAFKFLWRLGPLALSDIELLVQIILASDNAGLAEKILDRFLLTMRENPTLLYLMAQVQFFKRDYLRVMTILAILNESEALPKAREACAFWIGAKTDG